MTIKDIIHTKPDGTKVKILASSLDIQHYLPGGITMDYDKFVVNEFNRDLKIENSKLDASMKEHGFFIHEPVAVDVLPSGKLLILRGHHRFAVAKANFTPVAYVISNHGHLPLHELEMGNNSEWVLHEYLTSHIRYSTSKAYFVVKDFMEKSGMPLSACIALLGTGHPGNRPVLQRFKRGDFKVKFRRHANDVMKMVAALEKQGKPFASSMLCVQAISRILHVPELSQKQLLHKIGVYPHNIKKQTSLKAYVSMFDTIYNKKSSKRIPLSFLADELMKLRQKTGGK
jgi:hypothetical protein